MPKEFPEQRDPVSGHAGRFADDSPLSPEDRALLESATTEAERDPADVEPETLADDEDVTVDIATQPMSEITEADDMSGYGETEDGLNDLEEAVRQQAEDRPLNENGEDYTG
ncbi:hypothetical protein [Aurantimonas sp. Leaf443]|uniref:hypothetical protein n=1 Tax=Aurantimonas sp. Leaf443 TaxID=1736378 RepID=UPI0006FDDA90|nr:hypothetical protein [Aurantimonas sp. Leaf443]KQT86205.1 hypothetical protein ASG48_06460 [Aurantimonas sp. Leaf443]